MIQKSTNYYTKLPNRTLFTVLFENVSQCSLYSKANLNHINNILLPWCIIKD